MKKTVGLIIADTPVTCRYVEEVLAHAGLFPAQIIPDELVATVDDYNIILLAGNPRLDEAQRDALVQFITDGGALVAVGHTAGLEKLLGVEPLPSDFTTGFGVDTQRGLGEGYIQIRRKKHPVTRNLESSLHTFGGVAVRATEGKSLAKMRDALHRPTSSDAIVEHRVGKGLTLLIAPDLFYSIVRIQQGTYIDQDGIPAADGSAPFDDGILKCEDGMTLNFEWDRTRVDDENRIFYHPIADELRELVIKSVLHVAQRQHLPLAMLWYYPRNLLALGHISHDSDINDAELGWSMLRAMQDVGIKSTWCIIEPGYSTEFYDALKEDGYEIALHYDALDGGPRTSWSEHAFRGQHDWLSRTAGVNLVSNKNHYTRWEGRLDFFRWCVAVGIQCDQSKGPSKRGVLGYPFGGCHPWFPLDDDGSPIDCLELNLQTQDLVVTSPDYFGHYWVDQAVRHHGVAHLLFHPAHIEKPGVATALRTIVDHGTEQGLEWWTCARINHWERARRGVQQQSFRAGRKEAIYHFSAERPLQDATLLFLNSGTKGERTERYGFTFHRVDIDLEGETEVRL